MRIPAPLAALLFAAAALVLAAGSAAGESRTLTLDFAPDTPGASSEAVARAVQRTMPMILLHLESVGLGGARVATAGPRTFSFTFDSLSAARRMTAVNCLLRPARVQFRLVATEAVKRENPYPSSPKGHRWVRSADGREERYLVETGPESGFTNRIIASASSGSDPEGRPLIHFKVRRDWVKAFTAFTSRYLKRALAIIADGQLVSAPVIMSAIQGDGQIVSPFEGKEDHARVVRALKGEVPTADPVYRKVLEGRRWLAGYSESLDVFVRYCFLFDPRPVNADWIAAKAEAAAKLATAKRKNNLPHPWFVAVYGEYEAVYFAPAPGQGRVRTGLWVRLGGTTRRSRDRVLSYRYLAPEKTLFARRRLPLGTAMPCEAGSSITDAEFASVVTYLGSSPSAKDGDTKAPSIFHTVDATRPILSMDRKGDRIVVRTGVQHAPLAGSGQIIHLAAKPGGGYEVVKLNPWRS